MEPVERFYLTRFGVGGIRASCDGPLIAKSAMNGAPGNLIGQEQAIRDDLLLESLSIHLESSQHGTSALNNNLLIKKSRWNRRIYGMVTGPLGAIYAHGDVNSTPLASLNYAQEVLEIEVLSAVQDGLAVAIGWIAVDQVS